MTKRLIETWLPIAQIGSESLRERTPTSWLRANGGKKPSRVGVVWNVRFCRSVATTIENFSNMMDLPLFYD